jgi:hypothetical protein
MTIATPRNRLTLITMIMTITTMTITAAAMTIMGPAVTIMMDRVIMAAAAIMVVVMTAAVGEVLDTQVLPKAVAEAEVQNTRVHRPAVTTIAAATAATENR